MVTPLSRRQFGCKLGTLAATGSAGLLLANAHMPHRDSGAWCVSDFEALIGQRFNVESSQGSVFAVRLREVLQHPIKNNDSRPSSLRRRVPFALTFAPVDRCREPLDVCNEYRMPAGKQHILLVAVGKHGELEAVFA